MTVCVAALGAYFRAIVCVADKALSYGDRIQWDSDSSKILRLNPSGALVMFAGDEEPTSKVLANLIVNAGDIGGKPRAETIKLCENLYKQALDELVESKFLTPRLLKRSDYLDAIKGPTLNNYIRSIAKEINDFNMECDLIVCGFDVDTVPFIVNIPSPGIATDMTITGFHAIGSGWERATSRLLFSEHKRAHSVARTLYDAFDAKANAEISAGVGYEWDAVVSIGGAVGFCDISQEIKDLIERVWAQYNRSPFDTHDQVRDIPLPPKNWKSRLEKLINRQVLSKLAKMEAEVDRANNRGK